MLKKLISLLLVMGMLAGSFGVLAEETEISGDIDLAIEEVETEDTVYSDIPEIDEEEEDIPIIEEISEGQQSMLEDSEPAGETTTEPVDDSTTLADGEYTPDGFDFTGGTGKVKIVCDKVIVANGKASAVIKFSSNRYNLVKASGQKFTTEDYADSEYTIPIDLNVENRILATTYAMTEPHEVEYMITVKLAEPETAETTTEPVDDSTTLADGEYVPDDFSYSGGTGKTTITCTRVIVVDGKASAEIEFSSKRINILKAGGNTYTTEDNEPSVYTIPIDLNAENKILATTFAMTEPHEIEYTIFVTLDEMIPAEEPEYEDGEYVLGIQSNFSMFKITTESVKASGNVVTVSIGTAKNTYDKIYLGSKDDEDKSSFIQGVKREGEDGYVFTFVLDKKLLGQSIDFVPGKPDGTWYEKNQYQLIFPGEMDKKIEDGDYVLGIQSSFSMFKITTESVKASGNVVTVSIGTAKNTYDKIYLGSKDDADKSGFIQGVKREDEDGYVFTFVLDKKLLGQSIDFVPGKPDGTWYEKNQYQLIFPGEMEKKIEDGDYQFPVESNFSMFKVTTSVAAIYGNVITVTIGTAKNTYDKIYLGSKDDEDKSSFIQGVKREDEDGYVFTFVLNKKLLGQSIDFVPGKPDGTWYEKNQYQLTFPAEQGEKIEPAEDDEPSYADGIYVSGVDSWTGMGFEDAVITIEGDTAHVVLDSKQTNYTKLYIGDSADNAERDANAVIGVFNKNHTGVRFTFDLAVENLGKKLAAAFWGTQTFDPKWSNSNITFSAELKETEPEAEIDIAQYADGEYIGSAAGYVQKIEDGVVRYRAGALSVGSTMIKVAGDKIIVTITGISQSSLTYDKFGIATLEDIAAGIEPEWIIADISDSSEAGMNFVTPVYTFTLPKTCLGELIPTVLHKTSDDSYFQGYLEIGNKLTKVQDVPDQPDPTPGTDEPDSIEDGDYRVTVDTGAAMFKVIDCKLFAKGGKYTAILTLSGEGYDYLFAGTAEEAGKADASEYIPFVVNAEGKYTYRFPVSALGTAIPAASHSIKNNMWYDRTLTFLTSTAEAIDHIPGEAVIENVQESTYTEEGSCEEVIYCEGCGAEISRVVKNIPVKEYPVYDMAQSKNKQQFVNIDEKLQLTVSFAEEKGYTVKSWKSSNAKIASVDNGLVTGIKEGKATITVTFTNKKTAKVTVSVVDPKKPVKVMLDSVGTQVLAMAEKFQDNETLQLTPAVMPETAEAEITWKSSNNKVAQVDQNGLVTPIGSGSAVITVTAKYKKTAKTASVKVKVTDPYKPMKVITDVTGTQNIEMGRNFADNTLQLTPTVIAANGTEGIDAVITWKSSSTKVVRVSETGHVIPMGAGTATVTVTAKRSGVTKTASVKVVVTDPFKLTNITMNAEGTQIVKVNDTLKLSAAPDPDAEVILTWKSSNKKIAVVDADGMVTGMKAGNAVITVTASRGKVSKTASIKVKVES